MRGLACLGLVAVAARGVEGQPVADAFALDAADTMALLQHWGITSVVAACKDAIDSEAACDGSTLRMLSDSMDASSPASQTLPEVLHAASAKDVFTLGLNLQRARNPDTGTVEVRLSDFESHRIKARRQLASSSTSGLAIRDDEGMIQIGADGDVVLQRTSNGELAVGSPLVLQGPLMAGNASFSGDWLNADGDVDISGGLEVDGFVQVNNGVTVSGHLEVDNTISTGFGRITRDFHQYYTTTSTSAYYQMKTSIKVQGAVMYRLEILGYAYGAAESIDSVTTGYTYSGWDCVSNEDNIDYAYGNIGVYCSTDGYVVLEYYCPATYYLGLTVSGWFLNPTGTAHDITVLDTAFSSSSGYFAGRRQLEDDSDPDPSRPKGDLPAGEDWSKGGAPPADAVLPNRTGSRLSLRDMQSEIQAMRPLVDRVTSLEQQLGDLATRVEQLELFNQNA